MPLLGLAPGVKRAAWQRRVSQHRRSMLRCWDEFDPRVRGEGGKYAHCRDRDQLCTALDAEAAAYFERKSRHTSCYVCVLLLRCGKTIF